MDAAQDIAGTAAPDATIATFAAPTGGAADVVTLADSVAAAVEAVPGVASLHSGSFGEVATYLPGRRVAGVRIGGDLTEVHVVVAAGTPVLPVAEQVRSVVAPLVATPVDVYIEDVASPDMPAS